jgi:hypothetical protein
MKKIYIRLHILFCFSILFTTIAKSEPCTLTASYSTYESRCAATGSIKINALGGSGNYKYKVTGPVNTNYTSTDSITGLSAGVYILTVTDVLTNCTVTISNVTVAGSYKDPRFTLEAVDVSCDNGSNGSISVSNPQFGRAPFLYSIVAPSPMGVGTTNSSGIFNGLSAGSYSIQMTDSCGGIQTRTITIGNYTWWIDSYPFSKISCDTASGYIKVIDSRGNISTVGTGIPNLSYGIVRSPGDTLWSTNPNFIFSLNGNNSFEIIVKDVCGTIKKAAVTVYLQPNVNNTVNTYNFSCDKFDAAVTGVVNFIGADFCLYDSNNVQIQCNASGIFTNLPYGKYCIAAHDSCTDTTITRCFNAVPPPLSINNTVLITNKTCTDFTASITGQVGLTNPEYCLYDSLDALITCDSTGIFTHLAYGHYCIKTKDGCRDTTITSCFTVYRPTPRIFPIVPAYINCNNFGIGITGDSLTNPQYCLYDNLGAIIACNDTGIFDSLAFGSYCVSVYDPCVDTTLTSCFSVGVPVIDNNLTYNISNQTCTDFTLHVDGSNLTDPDYCLYDSSGNLIICDSSGIFNNLLYGYYCVKAKNSCPDTSFTICFNVTPPIPSVGSMITISKNTCTTFSASVTKQTNLTKPTYCLYDSLDVLIVCNKTGVFDNLLYGSYCIKITNTCYDTTITRCFTASPPVGSLSGNATASCTLGYAKFNLTVTGGLLPVIIKIYAPDSSLFYQSTFNSSNITVDSILPVKAGLFYKIIYTDKCGNADSIMLGAVASYFTHTPTVVNKCPGATWAQGSGNIVTTVSTNLGALTIRIIKKDSVTLSPSLLPNTVSGNNYTFIDLGPGVYIISANENKCNINLYDTITINPYQYPNLSRSSAYQCDVNGFSVSAIASNGVGPFTYEIISSVPSTPSIITGPQTSPIFNINNGANYSLIRLRALDACGNATLGDASILPLVLNGIVATEDCLFNATTLSTDTIFNATYNWYKYNDAGTDSTFLGNGTSYSLPSLLPSDTGIYVCHLSVNTGCVNRTYLYHLTGDCGFTILAETLISFTGKTLNDNNTLDWKITNDDQIKSFIIERKNGNGHFINIGKVNTATNTSLTQQYHFIDTSPMSGKNYYRLKMQNSSSSFKYSNTIVLDNGSKSIFTIYPNPAQEKINIEINIKKKHSYTISLFNALGQQLKSIEYTTDGPGKAIFLKTPTMKKGMYILRIVDVDTKEIYTEKVIFL